MDERKPLQRSDVQIWAARIGLGQWGHNYSFWAESNCTLIVFKHLGKWWSGMMYKLETSDVYRDQIWDVKPYANKRDAMKAITGPIPSGFQSPGNVKELLQGQYKKWSGRW